MSDRRRLVSPTGKRKTLPPVRPNAGVEAHYRQRMEAEVAAMHRSIVYWVKAQWRANTPHLAQDDDAPGVSPARGLRDELDDLGRHWESRFADLADDLARHFAKSAVQRADGALKSILKRNGWTVEFRLTREANDVLQASVAENVAMIKSIAAHHLTQVQGAVMRSVQTGRDLETLTKSLEHEYGVTRRRAAFIARDQNNKATAAITRVRQQSLGITQAVWLHSGGGRHPRKEHVAFAKGQLGGPVYDIAKGAFLEGKWVFPGAEPNCRCVCKPVVEGFS